VPARLKFLRALVTEKRHISALVTRYAMAYPAVRFRLAHDGRLVFRSSGSGELKEALVAVQGLDTVKQMLEVRGEDSGVRVYGYTSAPSLSRANRTQITFFVNGRWVQDQGLAYAVIQAYHTMLMTGRYPMVILMIDLSPTEVDVNVHPTKAEIRFRDKEAVFRAVQRSVRRALVESAPGQPVGRAVARGDGGWTIDGRPAVQAAPSVSQLLSHLQVEMDLPALKTGQRFEQDGPHSVSATSSFPALRVIGQVGASYIVAEGPGELVVIDQHAAHERILYEQYMAQRQTGIQTQALLEPFPVELTPDRAALLEDSLPALADLGFLVEHFGGSTFMVRGLPAVLGPISPAAALEAVVDDLELGKPPMGESLEEGIVARVCKTAAIKAGQVLTLEEMSAMVRQLERCETPHTCPHGRPTMITLSSAHIARQFGRT
jgi:DNA mismatch repair protein MutL